MNLHGVINKLNTKNIILVIFGSLISSIGINMFLVNAHLYSGGVSGIAILIQYSTQIPSGYIIMLINIPLLFISYKKLNKRFTIFSLIGTVAYSIFLLLTKDMQYLVKINDILLYSLYGGLLNGVGIGIAFSNHGSMGGINIITMLVKKKYDNFHVGQIGFVANLAIVFVGVLLHGLPIALYTLLAMYITSMVTDKIIHGISRKKLLLIITEKEKEVCNYITTYMHKAVTILNGQDIVGKERKVLYCVVQLSHLPEFKYSVQKIDKDIIISIIDASEVDSKEINTSIL